MDKKIISILFFFIFLFSPQLSFAAENNIVTPVFIIRGREFWRQTKNISELTQITDLLKKYQLPATFLVHYDVLYDSQIITELKKLDPQKIEVGLFSEITRKLADSAFVPYDWTIHWSAANNIFLSGYSLEHRRLLIDKAFTVFKNQLGYYPQSYGSWYTDVFSQEYIRDKYQVNINLGLADQYSTDGYQSWGQYINQPYFTSQTTSLEPAYTETDSTQVLKVLWAPREPTLSFGDNFNTSNYSLQVNDYHRWHNLDSEYTEQFINQNLINISGHIAQLVFGIEASEIESNYFPELERMISYISSHSQINPMTLTNFNNLYRQYYSSVSPSYFLHSAPDNSTNQSLWYFSPFYRIGIFQNNDHLFIKDLRYYHQNPLRDNDQLLSDINQNLYRINPAIIDSVVLNNSVNLGTISSLQFTKDGEVITIFWDKNKIILSPQQIIFSGPVTSNLPQDITPEINIKPTTDFESSKCHSVYGGYSSPFSCPKQFISKFFSHLPQLLYSEINNQKYFGFQKSPETIFALRFPKISLKTFHFTYPILNSFINLTDKIVPKYSWIGRQEYDLINYPELKIITKSGQYGQENILDQKQFPIFENSYYYLIK